MEWRTTTVAMWRRSKRNFRGAVDEYLAFCALEGKTPNKPFKGSLNVGLSEDLRLRAARFAEEDNMKINAVIDHAQQEYLSKPA